MGSMIWKWSLKRLFRDRVWTELRGTEHFMRSKSSSLSRNLVPLMDADSSLLYTQLVRHGTLSWARWIQSTPSVRAILILSTVRLSLSRYLCHFRFHSLCSCCKFSPTYPLNIFGTWMLPWGSFKPLLQLRVVCVYYTHFCRTTGMNLFPKCMTKV
jgi:hypothetical protein